MTDVTVLGAGPMGQALARALLRHHHRTTVWNRTTARTAALTSENAELAATAEDAVAASDLVIPCVLDHAALREIITPLAATLRGRTLINLTTGTPAEARETAAWAARHGIDYLDGAIMTPAETIGGPLAVVLYSGSEQWYETHLPTLRAFGGTAIRLGDEPGRAAAYDMALLDLFWTAMSGLVHAFALAGAEGISASELAPHARGIGGLLPAIIDDFAGRIDADRYDADGSDLRSAVAGMTNVLRTAQAHGLDTAVLDAALTVAKRAPGSASFARLARSVAVSDSAVPSPDAAGPAPDAVSPAPAAAEPSPASAEPSSAVAVHGE
ncbi:NAD(P)-binding domain-containing protein [Actinoplanes sichuanensis]|uniref:NAD(P)-dependent oxidoreductase n=1 Tax=Actinoplanes sichuanensis TaxID=512349 RepID=A0ABW4AIB9_9ACTN|nr:NAD(P)-binding domain-containing protein [Actinoplanes sichuanensis]BEL03961.1 NAD(P)-binding domain-containing protein [Actinoplanes sichuanensis]